MTVFVFACLQTMLLSVNTLGDKPISFEQLPAQSQQLIKDYFSGESIALIKMDTDILDTSYEVIFTDGNKIEFDRKGNWKEIDCKRSQCPEKLIPVQIRNHAKQNFPNAKILKIEKEDRNGYDIDLSNGINLEFDSNYQLIDIED